MSFPANCDLWQLTEFIDICNLLIRERLQTRELYVTGNTSCCRALCKKSKTLMQKPEEDHLSNIDFMSVRYLDKCRVFNERFVELGKGRIGLNYYTMGSANGNGIMLYIHRV